MKLTDKQIDAIIDRAIRKAGYSASRHYAFDGEGPSLADLKRAHYKLASATDAIGDLLETGKFDFGIVRQHAQAAIEHASNIRDMLGGGEGEDDFSIPPESNVGKDGTGEVPPEPVVSTSGRRSRVDHRRDFADLAQGGPDDPSGRDSAINYDINTLLQRNPDDPGYRDPAFNTPPRTRRRRR